MDCDIERICANCAYYEESVNCAYYEESDTGGPTSIGECVQHDRTAVEEDESCDEWKWWGDA